VKGVKGEKAWGAFSLHEFWFTFSLFTFLTFNYLSLVYHRRRQKPKPLDPPDPFAPFALLDPIDPDNPIDPLRKFGSLKFKV